ncbi:MAG: hypothetical protein ABI972_12205 [Acidobacteriota bacterium]
MRDGIRPLPNPNSTGAIPYVKRIERPCMQGKGYLTWLFGPEFHEAVHANVVHPLQAAIGPTNLQRHRVAAPSPKCSRRPFDE